MTDAENYAVVDLGTNTFHLLIGRWHQGKLLEHYRERHFIKLAAEGIETIGEASAERALAAAQLIGKAIELYQPAKAVAYGTAALRTASNGAALRQRLSAALGVEVQLIDGHREAQLITAGVLATHPPSRSFLIMDIGGGSVEFILVVDEEVRFGESYAIGAQVLKSRFHVSEPFGKTQHAALDQFLATTLSPVLARLTEPLTLVGASGTFDVLAAEYGLPLGHALTEIEPQVVSELFGEVLEMSPEQRLADIRIPADRADMIAVALGLIEFFIECFPQLRIITCAYALKEGALVEMSS